MYSVVSRVIMILGPYRILHAFSFIHYNQTDSTWKSFLMAGTIGLMVNSLASHTAEPGSSPGSSIQAFWIHA